MTKLPGACASQRYDCFSENPQRRVYIALESCLTCCVLIRVAISCHRKLLLRKKAYATARRVFAFGRLCGTQAGSYKSARSIRRRLSPGGQLSSSGQNIAPMRTASSASTSGSMCSPEQFSRGKRCAPIKFSTHFPAEFTGNVEMSPCAVWHHSTFYSSRSATATGRTAARTAGNSPPRTPIASAKITPITSRSKVILKAKAIFENV
jgi:hypothetical protein